MKIDHQTEETTEILPPESTAAEAVSPQTSITAQTHAQAQITAGLQSPEPQRINFQVREAAREDLPAIRKLQQESHFSALNESEKAKEGFISLETPPELLERIRQKTGIVCAVDENGLLIGYIIPLPIEFGREIPFLTNFLDRVDNLTYQGQKMTNENSLIGGQICVRRGFKGKGIIESMGKSFTDLLKGKYQYVFTEISAENPRSLHANTTKMGMEILQKYTDEGKDWYIVAKKIE